MQKTVFVKGIPSVGASKYKGMINLIRYGLPVIVTILKTFTARVNMSKKSTTVIS
jgi:hypothetical protein